MNIIKIKIIITIILLFPILVNAQNDCNDFFKYRKPDVPFEYNSQSMAAVCVTGNTYDFILTLTQGKDYRLKFYAAAVFNNKINFKIIDLSTHETVLDLPGETELGREGTCVLRSYNDRERNKTTHPYFDFFPATSTKLKIIMEVEDLPGNNTIIDNPKNKKQRKQKKGCITIVVLDKPAIKPNFKKK